MRMTRFEKWFVNRRKEAERNIGRVCGCLQKVDVRNIHDVLEIGCGIGAVSAYLANNYEMSVQATDFDPEQIEAARKMYPESDRLHFAVADATGLTFDDASFDLVLSQDVFHHIPNWETAIREVARVLRPSGYLIWFDLAFPEMIVKVFRPIVRNYAVYTFDEVASASARAGLMRCFYERWGHGPFTHHHMVLQKADGGGRR
jgi:ubiquinone/menaquinone biosynthesis C-methylase UbiE